MIHMITKLVDMHRQVIFYTYKYSIQSLGPGGGGLPYKTDGDARRLA